MNRHGATGGHLYLKPVAATAVLQNESVKVQEDIFSQQAIDDMVAVLIVSVVTRPIWRGQMFAKLFTWRVYRISTTCIQLFNSVFLSQHSKNEEQFAKANLQHFKPILETL